jgi:hypothetical protein
MLTDTPSMPESPEDREERLLRELEAKNVAHYSVMLDAWIQTRMALDKSLITLSAGGIGVLVTLLTTVGVARRPWQIYLYLASFIGFLLTIGLALMIYRKNAELIENDSRGKSSEDLRLKLFDISAILAFCIGATFAVTIAVSSALTETPKESAMPDYEKRSLDGLSDLKPQPPEQPPAATQQPSGPQQGTTPPATESPKK